MKTLLFHNIVAPYRHALFAELATRVELEVWYSTLRTRDRAWSTQVPAGYPYVDLRGLTLYALGRPLTVCPGLIRRVRKHRPDVVIAVLTRQNAIDVRRLARWCRAAGARFVPWVGDVRVSEAQDQVPGLIAKPFAALTESALRMADGVISYSGLTDQWLDRRVPRTPRVTGTQVLASTGESPRFEPRDDQTLRLLYVGKLEPRKGITGLVSAVRQLETRWRDRLEILVAGTGPQAVELQQLEHDGVRVKLLGHVAGAQMPEVYRSADLLVLPSLEDPWGFVVNEAMSVGTPALVSRFCGSRELASRAGWVTDVTDSGAFAASLAQALQGCRSEKLRREAFAAVGHYTPAAAAQRIAAWLNTLCTPGAARIA
jgi:glycosyltransferase involved in cell wall biosynthesis